MSLEINITDEPTVQEPVVAEPESKPVEELSLEWARKYAAEFFATMLFVYIGTGSVAAELTTAEFQIVGIALAFGLGIVTLAYTIGSVSGGHINPAVTFACVLNGDLSPLGGAFYVLSQLLGAVVGSALVMGTFGDVVGNTRNSLGDGVTVGQGFLAETVLTFLLVLVVLSTCKEVYGGAAIGLAVFCAHIVAIPITGTGINPARSIGPAFVDGNVTYLWLFVIAPLLGSSIAVGVKKFIF